MPSAALPPAAAAPVAPVGPVPPAAPATDDDEILHNNAAPALFVAETAPADFLEGLS